jgi:hypothetical protein
MKFSSRHSVAMAVAAVLCVGSSLMALDAWAQRGGRGGGGGGARTSVNRGANVSHNANINRSANVNANRNANVNVNRNANVNVDRNVNVNRYNNVHVDVDNRWNHPVGTAVAIGATAAVVGSIIYSLPPSCSMVQVGGVTYQQCGSTWYQPRYSGTSVQYVVVSPPY